VRVANGAGEYSEFLGLWDIPSIPAQSAASMQLVVTVDSKQAVVTTAEVIRSDQYDPNSEPDNGDTSENDYSSVGIVPKLIDVSASANSDNANPALGEIVEMTFTVANAGPDTATGVTAAVTLPPGLELASGVVAAWCLLRLVCLVGWACLARLVLFGWIGRIGLFGWIGRIGLSGWIGRIGLSGWIGRIGLSGWIGLLGCLCFV